MGSLISRVERLEKHLNVCENRQDLSDFSRWGKIFTNMAKDKKKECDSIEIKVSRLPTTIIAQLFKDSKLITTINLADLTQTEKIKKIRDFGELNNAMTVSFDCKCRSLEEDYYRSFCLQGESIKTRHLNFGHIKVNDEPITMKIECVNGITQYVISQRKNYKKTYRIEGNVRDKARFMFSKAKKYNHDKTIWEFGIGDDTNDIMNEFFRIKSCYDKITVNASDLLPIVMSGGEIMWKSDSDKLDELEEMQAMAATSIAKHLNEEWRNSYELKEGIDGTTVIRTLGMIYVSNKESDPAIKKAKKMGLLDLWFNKVIR